jgi:transposase
MGAMLRITRRDYTSAELRVLSAKCGDGAEVRRMLALALVLDGRPRAEAAALNGMDRQTLCDWVHRYNAGGLQGLKTRKSPGKAALLSEAQKVELFELVIRGPDPAVNKVVRWRCVDLQAEVAPLVRYGGCEHDWQMARQTRPDPAAAAAGASEEG